MKSVSPTASLTPVIEIDRTPAGMPPIAAADLPRGAQVRRDDVCQTCLSPQSVWQVVRNVRPDLDKDYVVVDFYDGVSRPMPADALVDMRCDLGQVAR